MRLAHKYGMDPGAEWEAVWVVSSLLNHYDSQSSVVLAKSYSACQTLELESSDPRPEEVDGVTGDKDLQGGGPTSPRNRFTGAENKLMVTQGGGGGAN